MSLNQMHPKHNTKNMFFFLQAIYIEQAHAYKFYQKQNKKGIKINFIYIFIKKRTTFYYLINFI